MATRIVERVTCPDPQVGWYPFAVRRASRLIEKAAIDSVVVTVPPFSALLIGTALKRRYPQVRLVLDFRDEWLRYFLSTFAHKHSDYIRKRAVEIEREAVGASDRVIAVTTATLNEIRSRYPVEPEDKFQLVPNGYDPEQFRGVLPAKTQSERVIVGYVGTVYKPTSPEVYLKALAGSSEHVRERLETHFFGRIADEVSSSMFAQDECQIRCHGFLQQNQAIRRMLGCDYLLLTCTEPLSIPGKLFEYLASGKPILALVKPGTDSARVIEETRSGWCADPDDVEAVKRMLCLAAERKLPGPRNWEAIRGYERPRLAARYAEIIRSAHSA
jgi:glycosyltransferase involved in cell wall biosynthesis